MITRICPAGQKAPSVALSKDGQVGQKDDTCSEKGAMTFSPHKSGHGERFKQRMGTAHAAGDSRDEKRAIQQESAFRLFEIFSSCSRGPMVAGRRERRRTACVNGSNTSEIALEGARRRRKAQGTL